MTGEGAMTKAMILALALGIPLGSLLLQKQTVDPYLAIPEEAGIHVEAGQKFTKYFHNPLTVYRRIDTFNAEH